MNIKVNNNLSDLVKLDIVEKDDEIIINVNKKIENIMPLEEVAVGATVKIGEIECIALGKTIEGRFLITKKITDTMIFGQFNNDYIYSDIRKYCNNIFYHKLCQNAGKEDIIPHRVILDTDDGFMGKPHFVTDNVSVITTNYYRKFREFIPNLGEWWWTVTKPAKFNYFNYVCVIEPYGSIGKSHIGSLLVGIRPFFCLKSSLKVEVVDNN